MAFEILKFCFLLVMCLAWIVGAGSAIYWRAAFAYWFAVAVETFGLVVRHAVGGWL